VVVDTEQVMEVAVLNAPPAELAAEEVVEVVVLLMLAMGKVLMFKRPRTSMLVMEVTLT